MKAVFWPAGAPTGNCTVWNSINWKTVSIFVKRLQMRIAKVVKDNNRAVWKDLVLEMLEPYDGKLSRTVLRGLGASNGPRLPDHEERNMEVNTNQFYAGLTPLYHLVYPNWEASVQRQASMLDSVIKETWGEVSSILDVSCGIGTQSLGLAQLGYEVTASDLSPEEIERAKKEADVRNLSIAFSVADMRKAHDHHARDFGVVLSADNSVPHLLTDEDILTAFRQFFLCTNPGGGCIVTVRDYEKEDLSKQQVKPYGIREEDGVRWLGWQVWDPHPPTYDITMYFVEDRGGQDCQTHVMRSTYYAIGIPRLLELMTKAGFSDVKRMDGRLFQPIIIGTRKA